MKLITKLIITSLCVAPIAVGVATTALTSRQDDVLNAPMTGIETMTKFGKTLTLNKKDLSFKVTDNKTGVTWSSDNVNAEDKITSYRKAFLQNAMTVYFLTDDGGEGNFSIHDSGHKFVTKNQISEVENGYEITCKILDGQRKNPKLSLDVTFQLLLTEKGITLKVIDIKEYESSNRFSKLAFYPGFASSYKQVPGYMLIPDGSGALIDTNKKTSARQILSLDVYDSDIGLMDNHRKATNSEMLSMPMYAINNNNASTMVYLTSGDDHATLNCKAAGIIDNYNISYFSFNYREVFYRYQGIGEATKAPIPQVNANKILPEIHYDLIPEQLQYYDFANLYRAHLLEENKLSKAKEIKSDMRLEFLMAENKDAMFGKEVVKMTSTNFVQSKVKELLKDNIKPNIALLGYTKNGLTNSYPYCFPLESKTGSGSDYANLGNYLKENNLDYTFIVDLVRSFNDSGISNYDLAMNMSEKYIKSYDYNIGNDTVYNHLTLNETKSLLNEYKDKINDYNASGFDFNSIGSKLYSSYFNQVFTRKDAMNTYHELLNSLESSVGLRKPNQYLFDSFDDYLNASSSHSNFVMETSDVPFMSMLFSGYKNLYCDPINLNYTGKEQILRLVDFNINPTFLLTEESAINLLDTSSTHIFSSQYDDWKSDIYDIYHQVNDKLDQIKDATFEKREMVAEGVYLNTYSNGKQILVNYRNDSYIHEGHLIAALESEVI